MLKWMGWMNKKKPTLKLNRKRKKSHRLKL